MDLQGRVAVVTGGGHGIGRCVADEFEKRGADVYIIDTAGSGSERYFIGDVGCRSALERFASYVIEERGNAVRRSSEGALHGAREREVPLLQRRDEAGHL